MPVVFEHSPYRGEFGDAVNHNVDFDVLPQEYVVPAGHRLGLVVVSTDHDYTIRPAPGTRLTLAPDRSSLELPVVGGRAALGF